MTMKYIQFILFAVLAALCAGCSDNRPDAEVIESLRGIYPGGAKFCYYYEPRIISRGSEIVPKLIEASYDADPNMRKSVAFCLGDIATEAAVDRLIEMADDEEIGRMVWSRLGTAANPKAIPKLEEKLASHPNDTSKFFLLRSLIACGDRTRLDQLLELMKTMKNRDLVHSINLTFEKLAKRQFHDNPNEIEEWLKTYQPKQNDVQPTAAAE
jgi:hypothetical protein